jgi:UrcA family protein
MKTELMGIIAAAVASAVVGSIAVAQNMGEMGEITVQATRSVKTEFRISGGVPIVDVSLSYGVRFADLDIASHAGAIELEKRVQDAAMAACKEIAKQVPDSTPNVAECARNAAGKAMVKVHELEAAATKKSTK